MPLFISLLLPWLAEGNWQVCLPRADLALVLVRSLQNSSVLRGRFVEKFFRLTLSSVHAIAMLRSEISSIMTVHYKWATEIYDQKRSSMKHSMPVLSFRECDNCFETTLKQ